MTNQVSAGKTPKQRNYYLDLIRIIAILMVLYNHRYTYTGAPEWADFAFHHMILQGLATLCRCAVPLFFMVSGVVLLRKEESFVTILKHRIVRILIVMVLCTLIKSEGDFSPLHLLDVFFSKLNWYLYAYFDYLLMLPFLRKIALHTSFELARPYVLLVAFFYLASGFVSWFGYYTGIMDFMLLFNSSFASLCWAIIFTLTGYWIDQYYDRFRSWILPVFLPGALVSLVSSVILSILDFQRNAGANQELVRVHFIFLPTLLLFCALREAYQKIPVFRSGKLNRFLLTVSGTTFGIFLLETHAEQGPRLTWYVSRVLELIHLTHPYLVGLVSILAFFCIAFVIVWILKKIPYLNKLL